VSTGRIIVGVSGSLPNLAALHAAVAEARMRRLPLVAVRAWSPPDGELAYQRYPCQRLFEAWRDQELSKLRNAFTEAFGAIPGGVHVEGLIVRGRPGPVLVQVARRPGDLIVVGAGRARTIGRLWHGSIRRYIEERAACPVLVVPPPELMSELPRAWRRTPALR
jgi:nucleotide-binding universal stress UspA family protein